MGPHQLAEQPHPVDCWSPGAGSAHTPTVLDRPVPAAPAPPPATLGAARWASPHASHWTQQSSVRQQSTIFVSCSLQACQAGGLNLHLLNWMASAHGSSSLHVLLAGYAAGTWLQKQSLAASDPCPEVRRFLQRNYAPVRKQQDGRARADSIISHSPLPSHTHILSWIIP